MIADTAAVLAVERTGATLTHVVERARRQPQECGGFGEGEIGRGRVTVGHGGLLGIVGASYPGNAERH